MRKLLPVSLSVTLLFSLLGSGAQPSLAQVVKFAAPNAGSAADATPAPVSPVDPSKLAANGKPISWQFENEQQWLVDSIGRDIAETLLFAKLHDRADPKFLPTEITFKTNIVDQTAGTYSFALSDQLAGVQSDYKFTLEDYVWSTKNYEPYAAKLLQDLQLTPPAVSEIPKEFLATMANCDTVGLIAENERVSKALTEHPLDAGLHEQAALLQAKFNMEEVAGAFTEDRPQLSCGCAHLSIARALNSNKLGKVGQLAEVALELMSVRDGMVIGRLDEMYKQAGADAAADPTAAATMQSWIRALRIRATHDFREYDEKNHTAIEESQYVLRYCNDRGAEEMLTYIGKHHGNGISDALLRILANNNYSVEVGHVVSTRIVPAEINSFFKDYVAYKKTKPENPSRAFDDLNLTSKRCLTVDKDGTTRLNVLSWDDLAAFHCRHILSAIRLEYNFYQYNYGVPEMAKNTIAQTKKAFADVTLQPVAMSDFKLEPSDLADVLVASQKLLLTKPELITSSNWQYIRDLAKTQAPQTVLVEGGQWFDPPIPMGTAFFFFSRQDFSNSKTDLAELTKLRGYCPFFYNLDEDWLKKKYGAHPTPEQYQEAFGKLGDYSIAAMQVISDEATPWPDKFIPLEEKVAKLVSDAYFALGDYCVLNNRPEQAAKYYEIGIKNSQNAVLVANESDWLIEYRFSHGQKEKAKELADYSGDVFSSSGLNAMGRYYEKAGNLTKAEKAFRDIKERYETSGELAAFLIRNSVRNPKYLIEGRALTKEIFPHGMKRIVLADLKNPPQSGILIKGPDTLSPSSPLKKDSIIVGINGYEISNRPQYDLAAALSTGRSINVVFWNGKSYQQTNKVLVHNTLLRLQIQEYKN